jgi:hypothetical protein
MNSKSDFVKDAFLIFLGRGMTHLEALREFDRQEFNNAMLGLLDDHDNTLLALVGIAEREAMNEDDLNLALELWAAGWTSETPHTTQNDIFSWYWRRPPSGNRKSGRLFLSTNQAINALRRVQR